MKKRSSRKSKPAEEEGEEEEEEEEEEEDRPSSVSPRGKETVGDDGSDQIRRRRSLTHP